MNWFITSAPTLHTPVERLFGRRRRWIIACVACPPRLSFSFSFSVTTTETRTISISKHEISNSMRSVYFLFCIRMTLQINLPLSSPLRFFFSDTVTSVLIMGVSLLRSLELSTIADDDTTGADNGRDTALVVVKSEKKTTTIFKNWLQWQLDGSFRNSMKICEKKKCIELWFQYHFFFASQKTLLRYKFELKNRRKKTKNILTVFSYEKKMSWHFHLAYFQSQLSSLTHSTLTMLLIYFNDF